MRRVVLVVAFLFTPSVLQAQELQGLSNAELLAIVTQLQLRLEELERRVHRLEQEVTVRRPSSESRVDPDAKWRSRDLWDRLEKGMSRLQIEDLLGEPHTIREGEFEVWIYDRMASGSLTFRDEILYTWRRPR